MKTARIYIGTTDGPSQVQRVTAEDPEVRSVVCLDGKAIALPISDDYDSFVRRPTGVIEALTGHAAYRVDISHPINGGFSWQLGTAVAHVLAAHGRLAGPDDRPGKAVWLTGEVDHNLRIGTVESVGLKVNRAACTLKALMEEGIDVTIVVPGGDEDEAQKALKTAFHDATVQPRLIAANHLDEVLSALGVARRTRIMATRRSLPRLRSRAFSGLGAGTAGLAVMLVLAMAWPLGSQSGGEDGAKTAGTAGAPAPLRLAAAADGAPPRIALIESRAPGNSSCAAVHFGRANAAITRHIFPDSGTAGARTRAREIDQERLCDLRYRLLNPGLGALRVVAIAARHNGLGGDFRTKILMPERILPAGATVDLDAGPPPGLNQPLEQRLIVLALPSAVPMAARRLGKAVEALRGSPSAEGFSRAADLVAGQAVFVASAGEVFRHGWTASRKTGQTRP